MCSSLNKKKKKRHIGEEINLGAFRFIRLVSHTARRLQFTPHKACALDSWRHLPRSSTRQRLVASAASAFSWQPCSIDVKKAQADAPPRILWRQRNGASVLSDVLAPYFYSRAKPLLLLVYYATDCKGFLYVQKKNKKKTWFPVTARQPVT